MLDDDNQHNDNENDKKYHNSDNFQSVHADLQGSQYIQYLQIYNNINDNIDTNKSDKNYIKMYKTV